MEETKKEGRDDERRGEMRQRGSLSEKKEEMTMILIDET